MPSGKEIVDVEVGETGATVDIKNLAFPTNEI